MGRLAWVLLINFPLAFCWIAALSRGWPRSFLSTGTLARVLATVPSTPTLGFLLFRWFHLGLTAGCDYGGYGPPCVGALIRTFLWLSAELPLSRGDGPARSFRRGTLARVLATVPLHLLLAFSYFGGFIWG